jgi:hypothetical protein
MMFERLLTEMDRRVIEQLQNKGKVLYYAQEYIVRISESGKTIFHTPTNNFKIGFTTRPIKRYEELNHITFHDVTSSNIKKGISVYRIRRFIDVSQFQNDYCKDLERTIQGIIVGNGLAVRQNKTQDYFTTQGMAEVTEIGNYFNEMYQDAIAISSNHKYLKRMLKNGFQV